MLKDLNPLKAGGLMFPLFVPATRLDRLDKALNSSATFVIADLEDAVAPQDKPSARQSLASLPTSQGGELALCVRINGPETPWFEDDLAMVASGNFSGVILPKAENREHVKRVRKAIPKYVAFFGLVETAQGLASIRDLAPSLQDQIMLQIWV